MQKNNNTKWIIIQIVPARKYHSLKMIIRPKFIDFIPIIDVMITSYNGLLESFLAKCLPIFDSLKNILDEIELCVLFLNIDSEIVYLFSSLSTDEQKGICDFRKSLCKGAINDSILINMRLIEKQQLKYLVSNINRGNTEIYQRKFPSKLSF